MQSMSLVAFLRIKLFQLLNLLIRTTHFIIINMLINVHSCQSLLSFNKLTTKDTTTIIRFQNPIDQESKFIHLSGNNA